MFHVTMRMVSGIAHRGVQGKGKTCIGPEGGADSDEALIAGAAQAASPKEDQKYSQPMPAECPKIFWFFFIRKNSPPDGSTRTENPKHTTA